MEEKNVGIAILSEITTFSKYRKFIPELQRRETWIETCGRYESMLLERFPQFEVEIRTFMKLVVDKKVLPSMRMLQFAGAPVKLNNARGYNCSYLPIDSHQAFSETMFLLLSGCGVGYSVQTHHVNKLPRVCKQIKESKYVIGDSIEGWADAIKVLMKSYFGLIPYKPRFDYSEIRAKGTRLVTSGGKAPGPAPLKACLEEIQKILSNIEYGERLTPLNCHDILCHIANAVLAGGIRRAAMIALFSKDDEQMLNCKSGEWWKEHEARGRANNSVVLERGKVTEEEFFKIWKQVELSNAGEPGIYFTNDKDWGTNPCCEIALQPFQFCNLSEVNVSDVKSEADLHGRIRAAAFFGTLQSTFTDFHYLRPIWKETTEKERLTGVGMTGIASGKVLEYDLAKAARIAKETNAFYAKQLNINFAARVTTVKPSGTTSCVLGTSSGIHAWHALYYIRRQRIGKNEPLYTYLVINHPELLEDDHFRPDTQAVISIPQKAPEGSILREEESVITFLNRIQRFNEEWVKEGHNNGINTNNVSATISIDPLRFHLRAKVLNEPKLTTEGEWTYDLQSVGEKKDEWQVVGEWMWENQDTFNGLSVLPFDNGTYVQAPFETITQEEYERRLSLLKDIDLSKVVEMEDNTNHNLEAACAGGTCSI